MSRWRPATRPSAAGSALAAGGVGAGGRSACLDHRRKRPSVCGVLEDGQDGRDGRHPPDQVAEAVPPGQPQVAVIEELHDLARDLDPQEGDEDQVDALAGPPGSGV